MAAPRPQLHEFADGDALAHALAQAIAANLRDGIEARGTALLAVSGGKTPTRFFAALSAQALPWHKVTVTLVDERWVAPDSDRSNEHLVRANLLRGEAATAQFAPLYEPGVADPDAALPTVATRVTLLDLPCDALVLGMGEDGHTASFFPGGDNLDAATNPAADVPVASMRAPDAGEPRITLTMPVILGSRHLYLHIEGDRKRRVLWDATHADAQHGVPPIGRVLHAAEVPVQVFWCP